VIFIERILQHELNQILEAHESWIKNGEQGIRPRLFNYDLSGLDFKYANLYNAKLTGSNLSKCRLRRVNFLKADLQNTDLSNSNVKEANFYRANLDGAILENIKYDENTMFLIPICPQEGSFIGYKKTRDAIVKLLIPEDAKRYSATTYRCRTNKAKVLDIIGSEGKHLKSTISIKDIDFTYIIGEDIYIEDFDENNWHEGSNGIHFFLTKELAEKY
jgi:uncharacterized protein YjbI with pentapeptide repeats